ncbi:hypothetical protein niasHT_008254 [Heterodera trifolii]|uniref:Uncharacterized protein n=1 Tax=Heterodera trifolii TaxID=157864 RepID=A0ABD2M2F8_9BILA
MPPKRRRCCLNQNCEDCRRKQAIKAIEADNIRAKACQGEHDPACVVNLRITNPELHRKANDGMDAVVERITDGPIDVHCPDCDLVYSHYAVKWIGSERDWHGLGPGVTIVDTNQLDSNDVREFETEKREREGDQRVRGFAADPGRMAKKIVFELEEEEERQEEQGEEVEEEQDLEEEGEEEQESTSADVGNKKRRKKKKRSRGGKGFRDWMNKEKEKEASASRNDAGGVEDENDDAISITSSTAKKAIMNFALWRMAKNKRKK